MCDVEVLTKSTQNVDKVLKEYLNDLQYDLEAGQKDEVTESVGETVVQSCENVEKEPPQITNSIPDLVNEKSTENYNYNWKIDPKLLCSAKAEFLPNDKYENFTKGCQWSPDGTCLLVASDDYRLRIFDLPKELYSTTNCRDLTIDEFKSSLAIKDGGVIYDFCWYPFMDSWKPETCCFLSCSQNTPVHLWDAFTGELRATYRPYNQVDEVEAALSAQFINNSSEIWCGFKNVIRTFDINRPGRQTSDISLTKSFPNVTGLVSCIRENPAMPGLVAFGTYSKCIGLYKDGPICTFKASNGVTQVEFSPCGTKMYSAVRRGNEFLCWDLRNPGTVLWSSNERMSDTNQRIFFSLNFDGSQVATGGTDGFVQIWQCENAESSEEIKSTYKWQVSTDCVNGVNLHKSMPILATCLGQRLCDEELTRRDNGVQLWWCGN